MLTIQAPGVCLVENFGLQFGDSVLSNRRKRQWIFWEGPALKSQYVSTDLGKS